MKWPTLKASNGLSASEHLNYLRRVLTLVFTALLFAESAFNLHLTKIKVCYQVMILDMNR